MTARRLRRASRHPATAVEGPRESAGVTPIGLHGARHSYAELALASGVRLDVVSRQLGHSTIATTADIYVHDNAAAAEAAARIAEVLGGEGGG